MRYPWAPLEPYFGTDGDAASILGVTRRSVQRWKSDGLPLTQAERIADIVGEHPYILWPEMREFVLAGVERLCASPSCDQGFLIHPQAPARRYCSDVCRSRESMRRKYKKDPASKRHRVKQYDEANRETKRRYNRSYYRRNRERILAQQRERYHRKLIAASERVEIGSHPLVTMEPREEAA